ncbi:SDR family NAD(P)-dependent oxidoreductase [Sorangium sp. So ce145]|uniref:SDR family NAD(P)-dependent oxidoreductase n=1 Tax=Sorangium sp. So ce145 TaxID=3133285 RepID=UPI003F5E73C0
MRAWQIVPRNPTIGVTLARAGHRVFAGMRAITSKNAGPASELAELAAREGLALRVIELDVTSDASVDAGVARVLDEAGGVDVVINNAGFPSQGPLEAFTVAQAEATLQVNYLGAVRVNRAALPATRRQKSRPGSGHCAPCSTRWATAPRRRSTAGPTTCSGRTSSGWASAARSGEPADSAQQPGSAGRGDLRASLGHKPSPSPVTARLSRPNRAASLARVPVHQQLK